MNEEYIEAGLEAARQALEALLYQAWGVIANVSNGNWNEQNAEWVQAAEKWRDAWHTILDVSEAEPL